ncbi:MAG: acyl-CoA desaturase [Planctomycetota bacterium]
MTTTQHLRQRRTESGAAGVVARSSITPKIVNLVAVLLPFLALGLAIGLLWGVAFSWVHLAIMGGMYLVTLFGVTIGYHRFFTHKSFKTPRWMAAVLAIMGSMAVEGSILTWVAHHRRHHRHSDAEGDPHSPAMSGTGVWGTIKGMWHAHLGWMFRAERTCPVRWARDLQNDRLVRVMSKLFPLWVVLGLLLPAVLGGLLTMSWTGVLLGFLWGGVVRVGLVHHVSWSVNSVCHIWGTRPFKSRDESRNNAVFGVIALGEGWHNNHHAFPSSARHGLRWWEFDPSYCVIWCMSKVGLASEVRVPTPERMAAKKVY